jgi:GAF domain-containing protein
MAVERDTAGVDGATRGLGEVMGAVARQLQEEHGDVEATLQAITAAAVGAVPGAEQCGVSYVIGRRRIEPRAWTGDMPKTVDALQEVLGQGPCLDAVWNELVVRVDDVAADQRWPTFAAQAPDVGVGAMLCFQLFVAGDNLGALNLYAGIPGAFTDESEEVGLLFAGHAAVALAGAEHEHELRSAMTNRDIIGQAKGILMERYKIPAQQAFTLLSRTSSLTNRKLFDIADELTTTGSLPAT